MITVDRQEEFVLRTLEERDIRFVRLWFTDVLGSLKSVAVAPAELEGAFADGIGFDGSAIEGFARVYEADMILRPDPGTFQLLPWRGEYPGVARMFCDILLPDGSPSYADPRWVLKRNLSHASDLGFTFYAHPEIEFFLLRERPAPGDKPQPIDTGGYYDHTPHSVAHDFRRTAITMLESMGISVEYSHHEGAPGQQDVAEHPGHAGILPAPGQQLERRRVRPGDHVRLVNPGKALDRGAVETDPVGERAFQFGGGHRYRLQRAEHVGEPEPDEPDVPLLQRAQYEFFLPVHDNHLRRSFLVG